MSIHKQKALLALSVSLLTILVPTLHLTPTVHAADPTYNVTTILVGPAPVFDVYDPVNGNVYVGNSGSNTVSVISSSTNTVIATIVVGSNPAWLGWDPANGDVYVSNDGSSTVSRISSRTNTVVATIPVRSEERRVGKECRSRWS